VVDGTSSHEYPPHGVKLSTIQDAYPSPRSVLDHGRMRRVLLIAGAPMKTYDGRERTGIGGLVKATWQLDFMVLVLHWH